VGKQRPNIPSIREVTSHIKGKKFQPVYYFFGEDGGTIEGAVEALTKAISPLLTSEFDKEVISADNTVKMNDILDLASAFPFGDGKKLLIIRNSESIKDKQPLTAYIENPPDFTIIIFTQNGGVSSFEKDPMPALVKHGYIFESKRLKGRDLESWVVKKTAVMGKELNYDAAGVLIELAGDDRNFIEMQLNKLVNYIGDRKEITIDDIKHASSAGKEYSVFDLLDELGKGNKPKSLEIGIALLEAGEEILMILGLVSKYIKVMAHHMELKSLGMPSQQASREVGVSKFFYENSVKKVYYHKRENLWRAAKAILEAEMMLKSSAVDEKTVMTMFISKMIK